MSSPKTTFEHEVQRLSRGESRDARAALHEGAACTSLLAALHARPHSASAPTC